MMHLLDVGLRMEPVAVFIDPMQPVGRASMQSCSCRSRKLPSPR
jgi:hypothetical protein